jgi:hypothetical protein
MATTTTNYGFDIPQSTDLVKDGATAIATLGQDIDTAMNTALGTKKAGMVLLNTTSFSGVTSQSINDVFSSTYKSYKIVTNMTSNVATNLNFRWRVSGADNSTSNYKTLISFFSTGGTSGIQSNTNTGTSFALVSFTSESHNFEMLATDPFETSKSTLYAEGVFNVLNAGLITAGGFFDATTSFTGFTVFASGTDQLTGSISVYGFNA